MKTLYLTNSSANIAVDVENNKVATLDQNIDRYDIRQAFYVEEPMHVVFSGTINGEEHVEEIDVKKGDILLVFYLSRFTKKVLATIKCKEWVANAKNRAKIEQKEKEEWAKKNASKELAEGPCCGECCDCAGPF